MQIESTQTTVHLLRGHVDPEPAVQNTVSFNAFSCLYGASSSSCASQMVYSLTGITMSHFASNFAQTSNIQSTELQVTSRSCCIDNEFDKHVLFKIVGTFQTLVVQSQQMDFRFLQIKPREISTLMEIDPRAKSDSSGPTGYGSSAWVTSPSQSLPPFIISWGIELTYNLVDPSSDNQINGVSLSGFQIADCVDNDSILNSQDNGCSWYTSDRYNYCWEHGTDNFTASQLCCICGGGTYDSKITLASSEPQQFSFKLKGTYQPLDMNYRSNEATIIMPGMRATQQDQTHTSLSIPSDQMTPHPIFLYELELIEIPFNAFSCFSNGHCSTQVSYKLCDQAEYDSSGSCHDSIDGLTIAWDPEPKLTFDFHDHSNKTFYIKGILSHPTFGQLTDVSELMTYNVYLPVLNFVEQSEILFNYIVGTATQTHDFTDMCTCPTLQKITYEVLNADDDGTPDGLSFADSSQQVITIDTSKLIDYDIRIRCYLTDFVGLVDPVIIPQFRIRILPIIEQIPDKKFDGDDGNFNILAFLPVGQFTNNNSLLSQTYSGHFIGYDCYQGNCSFGQGNCIDDSGCDQNLKCGLQGLNDIKYCYDAISFDSMQMNSRLKINEWTCQPQDNCTIDYYLSYQQLILDSNGQDSSNLNFPIDPVHDVRGIEEMFITKFNSDVQFDQNFQALENAQYISVDTTLSRHFLLSIHGRVRNYERYVLESSGRQIIQIYEKLMIPNLLRNYVFTRNDQQPTQSQNISPFLCSTGECQVDYQLEIQNGNADKLQINYDYEAVGEIICQNIDVDGKQCENSNVKIDSFSDENRAQFLYSSQYLTCISNQDLPQDSRVFCCNCGGGIYTQNGPTLNIQTNEAMDFTIMITGYTKQYTHKSFMNQNLPQSISIQVKEPRHCIDYYGRYNNGQPFTFHKFECINDLGDGNDCQIEFTILDKDLNPMTAEEALPVVLHQDGTNIPSITLDGSSIVRNQERFIKGCIKCADNLNVKDSQGNDCSHYVDQPGDCGSFDSTTFKAKFHCCACRSAHQNQSGCAYTEKIMIEVLPKIVFPEGMLGEISIYQDLENKPFNYYVRFENQDPDMDVSFTLQGVDEPTQQALAQGFVRIDTESIRYGQDAKCRNEPSEKGDLNRDYTISSMAQNNACLRILVNKEIGSLFHLKLIVNIDNYSFLNHPVSPHERISYQIPSDPFKIFVNGSIALNEGSDFSEFDEILYFGQTSSYQFYYLDQNPISSSGGKIKAEVISEEQYSRWDEPWKRFVNDTLAIEIYGYPIPYSDEPKVEIYPGIEAFTQHFETNLGYRQRISIRFESKEKKTYEFRLRFCSMDYPQRPEEPLGYHQMNQLQRILSKLYICEFSPKITFVIKTNPLDEPYFMPYLQDFTIEFDPEIITDPGEVFFSYKLPSIINPLNKTQTEFKVEISGIDEKIMNFNQELMTIEFFNVNNSTEGNYPIKVTHISSIEDYQEKLLKLTKPQQMIISVRPKKGQKVIYSWESDFSGVEVNEVQEVVIIEKQKVKQDQNLDNTPVELLITDFNGEGQVTIEFSVDLVVPQRITQIESMSSRLLAELQETSCNSLLQGDELKQCLSNEYLSSAINIQLLSFDEELNDHQANLTAFDVEYNSWTEKELAFKVNFEQPTQVSQNKLSDKLVLNVLKPLAFISKRNPKIAFLKSANSALKLTIDIPRQMPLGISEQTIVEQAKEVSKWSYVILILQFIVQLVLKGRLKQMLILFFSMQLLKCIYLYDIQLPANANIVVLQVKKTVDFELLSLKHILVIIEAFRGKQDEDGKLVERYEKLIRQADNGKAFKTPEIFKNIDITIVVLVLMVFFGVLSGAIYFLVKKSRALIAQYYQKFKTWFIWNGLIDTVNVGFINYSIMILQNARDLKSAEDEFTKASIVSQITIMCTCQSIFLVFVISTLYSHSHEELRSKHCMEKFGSMYSEVFLGDNSRINKFIFPIQLVFRLFVVMIPLMTSRQFFQVQLAQFAFMTYLMVVFGKNRLFKIDKAEANLRLLIDYLILISFQSLNLFVGRLVMKDSDCDSTEGVCPRQYMGFVDNSDLQFTIGYALMLLCVFILFLCIFYLMLSIIKETSFVKMKYIFYVFMAEKGCLNLAKWMLMRKETRVQRLWRQLYSKEDIEYWVKRTKRFQFNSKGKIPVPADHVKCSSKYFDSQKELYTKMLNEQAIENILCLENIRNEQIRFVLEDGNIKASAEYRIFLRIHWKTQIERVLRCQAKLLRDVDKSMLIIYYDHAKDRGIVYDEAYFKAFRKNYIGLDTHRAINFLSDQIIRENNKMLKDQQVATSQITQAMTKPSSKKKKCKKKLKIKIVNQSQTQEAQKDEWIIEEAQDQEEISFDSQSQQTSQVSKSNRLLKSKMKKHNKGDLLKLNLEEIAEESLRAQERQSPLFQKVKQQQVEEENKDEELEKDVQPQNEAPSESLSSGPRDHCDLIEQTFHKRPQSQVQEWKQSAEEAQLKKQQEYAQTIAEQQAKLTKEREKIIIIRELEQEFGKMPGLQIMGLLGQQLKDKEITYDEYYRKLEYVEVEELNQ